MQKLLSFILTRRRQALKGQRWTVNENWYSECISHLEKSSLTQTNTRCLECFVCLGVISFCAIDKIEIKIKLEWKCTRKATHFYRVKFEFNFCFSFDLMKLHIEKIRDERVGRNLFGSGFEFEYLLERVNFVGMRWGSKNMWQRHLWLSSMNDFMANKLAEYMFTLFGVKVSTVD